MLHTENKFGGGRFANFADLETTTWQELYNELKKFSDHYMSKLEASNQWPSEYKWPKNSLQTNTRVWEYPYACDALNRFSHKGATVLDIGSALTFFPYHLANLGYEVHATDIDQQMINWYGAIQKNSTFIQENPEFGKLSSYKREDVTKLGFTDNTFDAVTNISVLEHLPYAALVQAVKEIHRALKPGGILVCTLDIHIDGMRNDHHSPLNQKELRDFVAALSKQFQFVENFSPVVPADMITNIRVPKDIAIPRKEKKLSLMGKLHMIKKIVWNENLNGERSLEWGAFGFTLKK